MLTIVGGIVLAVLIIGWLMAPSSAEAKAAKWDRISRETGGPGCGGSSERP